MKLRKHRLLDNNVTKKIAGVIQPTIPSHVPMRSWGHGSLGPGYKGPWPVAMATGHGHEPGSLAVAGHGQAGVTLLPG